MIFYPNIDQMSFIEIILTKTLAKCSLTKFLFQPKCGPNIFQQKCFQSASWPNMSFKQIFSQKSFGQFCFSTKKLTKCLSASFLFRPKVAVPPKIRILLNFPDLNGRISLFSLKPKTALISKKKLVTPYFEVGFTFFSGNLFSFCARVSSRSLLPFRCSMSTLG